MYLQYGLGNTPHTHEHSSDAPVLRPSCLLCLRKHLAQAMVLCEEAKQGYPNHRWYAVGHMAEASAESLAKYPALSNEIRQYRLRLMDDPNFCPPFAALIEKASRLAGG